MISVLASNPFATLACRLVITYYSFRKCTLLKMMFQTLVALKYILFEPISPVINILNDLVTALDYFCSIGLFLLPKLLCLSYILFKHFSSFINAS